MESSKIKNLIICLLALVNLFLAGLIVSDWSQTARSRASVNAAVHTILENNGITLAEGAMPDTSVLKSYSVSRNFEQEKQMVSSVLGSVTVQDQGGNIMYYYGEKGQANFRSSGDFEILFDREPLPVEKDAMSTVRSVLKKMGIQAEYSPQSSVSAGNTDTVVVMTVLFEGTPVINCQIKFTFATDSLLMVEGRRLLDIQREEAGVTILDAPTLLTRFIGLVNRNGYVCSEIREIRPVFQYSDASGGRLVPVWEVETNARTYYLNVSTGEEQSAA